VPAGNGTAAVPQVVQLETCSNFRVVPSSVPLATKAPMSTAILKMLLLHRMLNQVQQKTSLLKARLQMFFSIRLRVSISPMVLRPLKETLEYFAFQSLSESLY
jgi:hypothetical protein